jgi:Family of unknown function (DUF5640)
MSHLLCLKRTGVADSIAGMKKPISFQIVLGMTVLALLGGCAMFQESGQSALVGTWTNSLGTVWAIKADGTFQVALNNSNRASVWGKYTVAGDTMTIQESHGSKTPKVCKGQATYKFSRNGDTLQFTKVSDRCKLREKNVLLPWKPWKGK